MVLEQYFQPQRFIALLKVELSKVNRTTGIIIAAVIAILLVTGMVWAGDKDHEFHQSFYPFLLMAGGFFFTSFAFKELIEPKSRQFYLGLPASHFEKFAVKLLITSIGYATFLLVSYLLFSLVMNGLSNYYYDYQFTTYQPFSTENWLIFRLYLIMQGVYLLGAIAFRKYAFFKTVLVIIVVPILFFLLSHLLFRIAFIDYFSLSLDIDIGMKTKPTRGFYNFARNILWPFAQFIFWIGIPLFLWTVSYFKLTEKEV